VGLEESLEDLLWGAAVLAFFQNDQERTLTHASTLLDRSRAQGSRRGEAVALEVTAMAAAQRGDLERARELHVESLALAREVGDEWLITIVLNNLGGVEHEAGNVELAIELFEESLALGEERGDLDRRARELMNLGMAALTLGDLPTARSRLDDSLETARRVGLHSIYDWALVCLAAAWVSEDPPRAACLLGIGDAIAEQHGASIQWAERDATLARLRAASVEDVYLRALDHGRTLNPNDAVAYALDGEPVEKVP
jgi:tetratricopeptide (TPR) repeat protein